MFKSIYIIIIIISFTLNSCNNNTSEEKIPEEKIKYQHNVPTVWKTDTDNWYLDNKGIILHGKYKNWYRIVMTLPATNYTEYLSSMAMYTILVLEKYKKQLKDNKVIYKLHLSIPSYRGNIDHIYISFDDDKYVEYSVEKKDNIELYFKDKDVADIIQKLSQAKAFKIKYDYKEAYFKNVKFNESFNKVK